MVSVKNLYFSCLKDASDYAMREDVRMVSIVYIPDGSFMRRYCLTYYNI